VNSSGRSGTQNFEKLMNDLVEDRIDAYEELFKILDIKLKCPDDWNN
jgi:hypothetical protein